jgi:outer membrane protein TolC
VRLAERALRQHPALQSARLEPAAAHALARHHRAWEPPEVAADFYNAPLSSFPNPLRRQDEIDWSLSQKIPFPGKLRRMAEPEHARGAAAESRVEAAALDLRRRVLAAWADAYAAEWALRIARETRGDVSALARDARAGYSGGTGSSLGSLRAEREVLRLDAEILRMEAMRRETLAVLNSLAGGDTTITMVSTGSLVPPASFDAIPALSGAPGAGRPDLEAMRRERLMAEAEIAAARAERLPDFMVRGTYKDMRGNDAHGDAAADSWSLMLGMQIPFIPLAPWSTGVRQGERRARVLRDKAERDVAAMELIVNAEVETARAGLEAAIGRETLAREKIVPLTDRILAAARAEYASGIADFAEVTEALREARMAKEELRRAEADCLKAWAEWEWARGSEK